MNNPSYNFIKANIKYLFAGKLRTPNGNLPHLNHKVPVDFSCVSVAASENAAIDEYLIQQLSALDIQRVRLDFTYDDFENATGRLLDRLSEEQIKIHLHLIQPLAAANTMHKPAEQEKWRGFVKQVVDQYSGKLALIEVGSTVNRKRWAGYQLNSFLTAWDIAFKVIKPSKTTLAGPNVTDFEAFYNIGLLSLLKDRQQLPDIHTNNLFSERCTEPERDDHKIFGRKLAWLGKFRLVKKAHLLTNVGEEFGVKQWHSPAAFWTLPRIERLLPDSLEKQADYISRYMILAAASGTMQSAGWGPLVCHREGLIDDGVLEYPKLERITHYQSIGNDEAQYTIRPAFAAFAMFNKTIQGAQYQGPLETKYPLAIHVFKKDSDIWHVAWTTNGKAAILEEVYSSNLNIQGVFNRDGKVIELPSLITESPIYMQFNSMPQTNANIGILPHLAIHRYSANTQFNAYNNNDWQGMIAATDEEELALFKSVLNPANMPRPEKTSTLRKARNAIWTIPDPRDPAAKLVVKQPVKVPWFKKITDHFKPSKGLRSWTGANELLRRGIANAKPIAYFALRNDSTRTQNYYVCEFVPADFSVRELFSSYAAGENTYKGIHKQVALEKVADFLFNMHQKGVFFRDLSGGNILINKKENDELTFSLIDTGRAHFFNHPTAMRKRLSDMARACNKLDTGARNTLMHYYMSKLNKPFGWREKSTFVLYNAKVIVKRKTKLKNILKSLRIKK